MRRDANTHSMILLAGSDIKNSPVYASIEAGEMSPRLELKHV